MRLWHKDLIPVLPNKQLVSQWRECCAIIGSIDKNGTPGSSLVDKVLEYSILHFVVYTNKVLRELHNRNYHVKESTYKEFVDKCNRNMHLFNNTSSIVLSSDCNLYKYWHTKRYLKQCLFNLQEKYDCGIISDDEWLKIVSIYNLGGM